MTEHDLLDAIGDIDPAYLEEATGKSVNGKRKWVGVGALAACLVLFLIFPIGYRHYWMTYENLDYSTEDYVECYVYYVKDHALYYETAGIWGGDMEMFEVWKSKNGITEEGSLQSIVLSSVPGNANMGSAERYDTVFVTLSASLQGYFEDEDGAWRIESLKRTVASYRGLEIDEIELIFV